jgi:phospholipase C
MPIDRRSFLQLLTTGAAAAALPASIAKALAIPANNRTGSIQDVEHIVFMMQENRSFDHYFGTLQGVRGFGDPRTINLPNGKPAWYQPDPQSPDGYTLPFRPNISDLGLQFLEGADHGWETTHGAWNQGKYDQWIANKGQIAMAHLTRNDIPFHYALADAFTVCDAYHCALMGPTDPNRYYMWTGWVGNDGKAGGPVIDNNELGYDWHTYPERLQAAGISWKIYQDQGTGLTAAQSWGWGSDHFIGNFGDNSLLYFHQYQYAPTDSPLAERARTGTNVQEGGTFFDILAADVKNGTLPQVSWIVAPEAYTEHPNWPANYGAWYVSQMLDVLTSNPEVWSKTVFILMFDENDGFFDHMVPPTPPQTRAEGISTVPITNEIFTGSSEYPISSYPVGPYGMGMRVPMVVISPWSKGGYVNSEVFDHTSLIRFVEQRFGVTEPNITEWRRAVAGDLTSAFNFKNPNDTIVPLPSTATYVPPPNQAYETYAPLPPANQALPVQEPGIRPARAVPYELLVHGKANVENHDLSIRFGNTGKAAAAFQVRSGNTQNGPWTYTVAPKDDVVDTWQLAEQAEYDLAVYGPNGFYRAYKGTTSNSDEANLDIETSYVRDNLGIVLTIQNVSSKASTVVIIDNYSKEKMTRQIHPGQTISESWWMARNSGWYDLMITVEGDSTFERHLAGHIETDRDSFTDPAIAQVQ